MNPKPRVIVKPSLLITLPTIFAAAPKLLLVALAEGLAVLWFRATRHPNCLSKEHTPTYGGATKMAGAHIVQQGEQIQFHARVTSLGIDIMTLDPQKCWEPEIVRNRRQEPVYLFLRALRGDGLHPVFDPVCPTSEED